MVSCFSAMETPYLQLVKLLVVEELLEHLLPQLQGATITAVYLLRADAGIIPSSRDEGKVVFKKQKAPAREYQNKIKVSLLQGEQMGRLNNLVLITSINAKYNDGDRRIV